MTPRSLTPVADRLALIIPRLASDYDGEVVASARAIRRALHNAGLDFHDLTAALISAKPFERGGQEVPPLWNELSHPDCWRWLQAINGNSWLTDWEATFAEDILHQFRCGRRHISRKQELIINRLIGRAYINGVRP